MNDIAAEALTQLCDEMTRFAGEELRYDLVERDRHGQFLDDNWQACARKGVLGLYLPRQYGGSGYSISTTVRLLEALGYGCPDNGLTLALNGQMWAVQEPILKFGTEAQKEKYLPPLIRGEIKGAHGMTEPASGSNAFDLSTTADKVDGGFVLNGHKTYIGLGPVAGLILVFATLDPARGRWGISAFLVDGDSPGVTLGPPQGKMGLRTGPMGDVVLRDVFVPDDNQLGKPGAGASIFNASMDYERSFIFASHVGSMARQLDECVAYARTRTLADTPIGKHQAISHRIAGMKLRLETSRLHLYRAAELLDLGKNIPLEAAMAKLAISEAFVQNSLDAIRVHGGQGYLSEPGIERDLRDAVGGVIYSGTSDIQRNLIAGLLGL
jgi:alkylation response protein AidB-like acyl-CoA dehydrogenase